MVWRFCYFIILIAFFVFILGGAAGSVVASRLSEVKDWSVLLVEAGPDEPADTQIPSNLLIFLGKKRLCTFFNWQNNHSRN